MRIFVGFPGGRRKGLYHHFTRPTVTAQVKGQNIVVSRALLNWETTLGFANTTACGLALGLAAVSFHFT